MAHMVDTMAYHGQLPWHGLGAQFTAEDIRNPHRARLVAGLGWEPVRAPLKVVLPDGRVIESKDRDVMARPDRDVILGVVSKDYREFGNGRLFDVLAELTRRAGFAFDCNTAGSLDSGRAVWALLRVPDLDAKVNLGRGNFDAHEGYVLLHTRHDGTGAVLFTPTDVRVVCANTLGWADRKADTPLSFRIPHIGDLDGQVEQALRQLTRAFAFRAMQVRHLEELAQIEMTRIQMEDKADQIIMAVNGSLAEAREVVAKRFSEMTDRQKANVRERRNAIVHLARNGAGNTGRTGYDLLQGYTEFVDHYTGLVNIHPRTGTMSHSRFASTSLNGGRAQAKMRALRLIRAR